MSEREERLAMNEALFREMNDRLGERLQGVDRSEFITIICECADLECTVRIALTIGDYRTVREDPAQFVVVSGHIVPEIEEVRFDMAAYQVVRKLGVGEVVAKALDDPEPGV